ncbi:MAG TPA: hypothetical protein VHA56_00930 [Mucilaginibacter sp.]|nr:hypothetical protein [Mucilaginibacter sp.]
MNTIAIINDNSPADLHAAALGFIIARKFNARIFVCHTAKKEELKHHKVKALSHTHHNDHHSFTDKLFAGNPGLNNADYCVEEIHLSGFNAHSFAEFVIKDKVDSVIKGMPRGTHKKETEKKSDVYSVLNRVQCPLMLVPEHWEIKDFEQITYITDLRYCRIQIVRYLAQMAAVFDAGLSIAHFSARGLPDLTEPYAHNLFADTVACNTGYPKLFFNNIRETGLLKAMDVLINGMNNDLIVLINHRFHFKEIVGEFVGHSLPPHITVPLLIFPY